MTRQLRYFTSLMLAAFWLLADTCLQAHELDGDCAKKAVYDVKTERVDESSLDGIFRVYSWRNPARGISNVTYNNRKPGSAETGNARPNRLYADLVPDNQAYKGPEKKETLTPHEQNVDASTIICQLLRWQSAQST